MSVLKRLTLGRFFPGDSVLHRLDPRVKIGCAGLMMGVLFIGHSEATQACLLLFFILLGKAAALPLSLLLNNLRPLIPILFLTFFLNALWTPGIVLYRIPWLPGGLTDAGLQQGTFLCIRLSAVVVGMGLLLLTTSPMELADGIEGFFRPLSRFGFPAHEVALTISIALRFIPILIDEADRIVRAQVSRGADFGGHPVRRLRRLFPLLVPLFASAYARADRLAVAMEARSYRGRQARSQFRTLSLKRQDYFAVASVLIVSMLYLGATRLLMPV